MIPGVEASSRRVQALTPAVVAKANQGNSVLDQIIYKTSDWYVSFERMMWYVQNDLDTLLISTSDWAVSFALPPTWYESNLNDLPTLLAATSDWAVSFKTMTRVEDYGFDNTMLSLLPALYLPMVETVPYSENFDRVMMSLAPNLYLPMIKETSVTDYSFDDTMAVLRADLFLPMIREDVE